MTWLLLVAAFAGGFWCGAMLSDWAARLKLAEARRRAEHFRDHANFLGSCCCGLTAVAKGWRDRALRAEEAMREEGESWKLGEPPA